MPEPAPELVTLRELAAELSMDRSGLRKYLIKHQIATCYTRTPEGQMQRELALTRAEADRVHDLRAAEGFVTPRTPISTKEPGSPARR